MATLPFSGPYSDPEEGECLARVKVWRGRGVAESQQAPVVGSVAEVQGEVGLMGEAWGGVFMRVTASLVWALVGRASTGRAPPQAVLLFSPLPHPQCSVVSLQPSPFCPLRLPAPSCLIRQSASPCTSAS